MKFSRLGTWTIFGLAVAASGVANAQGGGTDGQNVRERRLSEFDPVGLPVGAFRLFPALTGAAETNDNVFAQSTNPVDDVAQVVSAEARLVSQWSQHYVNLEAAVHDTSYADLASEDDVAWNTRGEIGIDVTRNTQLKGSASYLDGFEARGANDPAALLEPIKYSDLQGGASISQQFNRFKATLEVDASSIDYEDGVIAGGAPFDQDFRDRTQVEEIVRGDIALSPDAALFVSYGNRQNDYDTSDRDFDRQRVLAGAAFDVTNLIRGEVAVGYSKVKFDDPTYTDFDGFSMRGAVDWFVTRITTVNLSADRDVSDSGDPRAGAASVTVTNYGARVDHELLRNVVLWVRGGWSKEEYEGFDRTDDVVEGGVGCDWVVNRWAAIRGRFDRTERDTSGLQARPLGDFDQNRWTLGVTLRR